MSLLLTTLLGEQNGGALAAAVGLQRVHRVLITSANCARPGWSSLSGAG